MALKYLLLIFLFTVVYLKYVVSDDEECSCVDCEMDELKKCKDWDDAKVQNDIKIDFDSNGHGRIYGTITVNKKIEEGVDVSLVVYLMTSKGEELMYTMAADLCQTLKDNATAWYPVMQAFKTSQCPIATGKYELKDVKINLSALKGFLTKDFVGVYSIMLSAELAIVKYFCVLIEIDIYSEQRLRNECDNPQD